MLKSNVRGRVTVTFAAILLLADGKYLLFVSSRSGSFRVYWVDAALIETLRPSR